MKYKYRGKRKINLNGKQYHNSDIVELESTNHVDMNMFVPMTEAASRPVVKIDKKTETAKKEDKKEVK